MSPAERTVGIIGGMGPEATIDLMRRIVAATPADDDGDHIRLLVDSNPRVPSRIEALIDRTGPSPAPAIVDMARGLERQGADVLVIACNTAHHYHADVVAAVGVPVLNMVDLAADDLVDRHPGLTRVGLLASSAVRLVGLYEPAFDRVGVEVLHPDDEHQGRVMELIRAVKAGRPTAAQIDATNEAAASLEAAGAERLLIACTELSAVADRLTAGAPLHDASEVLARAVARFARGAAVHD